MKILISIVILFSMGMKWSPVEKAPDDVRKAFNTLPLSYLPLLKRALGSKPDTRDNRGLFVSSQDLERGLLSVELSGDNEHCFIQFQKTNDDKVLLLVEHTACVDKVCANNLAVFVYENGSWKDAASIYFPALTFNYKETRKKAEEAYKTIYGDLEKYKSRDLSEDETLRKWVIYTIDKEENMVRLMETWLPETLAIYAWNEKKNRYEEVKK